MATPTGTESTSPATNDLPPLLAFALPEILRRIFREEIEKMLRTVLRQEIGRVASELRQGPAYLTIREAAAKYRLSYDKVRDKIAAGELTVVKRLWGRNGRHQWLICASDAEAKLPAGV